MATMPLRKTAGIQRFVLGVHGDRDWQHPGFPPTPHDRGTVWDLSTFRNLSVIHVYTTKYADNL